MSNSLQKICEYYLFMSTVYVNVFAFFLNAYLHKNPDIP